MGVKIASARSARLSMSQKSSHGGAREGEGGVGDPWGSVHGHGYLEISMKTTVLTLKTAKFSRWRGAVPPGPPSAQAS